MTVKLTYFKQSGKYYSEGSYETTRDDMYGIFEEVRAMLDSGKRPGLVDGATEFYVHAECPEHPNNVPALFMPERHGIAA